MKKVAAPAPATGLARVSSIRTRGAWGQLSVIPIEPVALHLGVGLEQPHPRDLGNAMRSRNLVLSALLVGKVGKSWRAGLEAARFDTHAGAVWSSAWQVELATQAEF